MVIRFGIRTGVRGQADKVLRSLSGWRTSMIMGRGTFTDGGGIPIYGVDIDETTTMPEIGRKH